MSRPGVMRVRCGALPNAVGTEIWRRIPSRQYYNRRDLGAAYRIYRGFDITMLSLLLAPYCPFLFLEADRDMHRHPRSGAGFRVLTDFRFVPNY